MDRRGRIRGEVRRYDPYARSGEIMLYDIDAFGFVHGYISRNWYVMSEADLLADSRMARRLREARYQVWKRDNISELKEAYGNNSKNTVTFEGFCRQIFRQLTVK